MLTIKDFYTLLTSGEEENGLFVALRKLAEIEKVDEIIEPMLPDAPMWW